MKNGRAGYKKLLVAKSNKGSRKIYRQMQCLPVI